MLSIMDELALDGPNLMGLIQFIAFSSLSNCLFYFSITFFSLYNKWKGLFLLLVLEVSRLHLSLAVF